MVHEWLPVVIVLLVWRSSLSSGIERNDCPTECSCHNLEDIVEAKCNEGNLNDASLAVLLSRIPINVTHLSIIPPKERPNRFSLTSDLTRFPRLKELRVQRSGITSLGKRMFETPRRLEVLDLSFNLIESITEETFENCDQILQLHLDSNLLYRIPLPSSSFVYLRSLRVLSLRNNRLQRLPNNFFNGLTQLRTLQLDGNSLEGMQHDIFSDLPNLHHLTLNHCGLTAVPPAIFSNPLLAILELSYNKLIQVPLDLAQSLPQLKTLNLRGNFIGFIPDYSFAGSSVERLNLAENFLGIRDAAYLPTDQSIQPSAFIRSKISDLNLSFNSYKRFSTLPLLAIAQTLNTLDLSGNPLRETVDEQLAGLRSLRCLHLAQTGIASLPYPLPVGFSRLNFLNLSGNPIESLNLESFQQLEVLDISGAKLSRVDDNFIRNIGNLKKIHLNNNPWDCGCGIGPLHSYLRQISRTRQELQTDLISHLCYAPQGLQNLSLISVEAEERLGRCHSPIFGAVGLTQESEVGILVAGVVLVVLIVALMVVVGCTYLIPKAATYRTREDSRLDISGTSADRNIYPGCLVKKERLFWSNCLL